MSTDAAIAQFCIEAGEALTRLGRALGAAASVAAPGGEGGDTDREDTMARLVGSAPGSRQKETLAVPGLESEEGLTTAQVHAHLRRSINDEPNTNGTLHRLVQLGLIEIVHGAEPRRWRLATTWRRLLARREGS